MSKKKFILWFVIFIIGYLMFFASNLLDSDVNKRIVFNLNFIGGHWTFIAGLSIILALKKQIKKQ